MNRPLHTRTPPLMIQQGQSNSQRFASVLLQASHLILHFLAFTMVIVGIQFLAGITLLQNEYVIPMALGLSVITVYATLTQDHKQKHVRFAYVVVTLVLLMAVLTWITGKIYDKSWDGMAYHQIGIDHMVRGWNPAYEQIPDAPQSSKYFEREINLSVWVNHYSKGFEQFSAALMALTGNIESGKVFNLLLIIAAFCSALHLLMQLQYFSTFWNVVIAAVAALNPVTVNQMFSYYLDGAVASCILILITQFILLYTQADSRRQRRTLWAIGSVSIVLINLKFTGLIYHAWIGIVFLGLLLYAKNYPLAKRFVVGISIAAILAIAVAGFNPYITNTVNQGHPFYPIAGKSNVDAIVHMVPPPLRNHNTAERFFASTFSRCDNVSEGSAAQLQYKIPFTFSVSEIKVLQSEGIRLGGFGVFWSGIFLLSILGAFIAIASRNFERKKYLMIILFAIVGSVALNPVSWWARFVPQLWLFPVVVLTILLIHNNNIWLRNAIKSVMALMLVNTFIIAVVYLYSVYSNTTKANEIFADLKGRATPVYVYTDIFSPNTLKLKYHNIPYIEVKNFSELPCSSPLTVLKMDVCIDGEPIVCSE